MSVTGQLLQKACSPVEHDGRSSASKVLAVSLTATNYLTQIAAGAAIDDSTGPFTAFSPTRVPQIVLGVGGVNPVVYTLTGTSITDGATITETITATGAGTYKSTKPFATITRIQSDVDPEGTTDLQAGDTWVTPPSRWMQVTGAGNVAAQLADDAAVATITGVTAGERPWRVQRINITNTTATGLFLLW